MTLLIFSLSLLSKSITTLLALLSLFSFSIKLIDKFWQSDSFEERRTLVSVKYELVLKIFSSVSLCSFSCCCFYLEFLKFVNFELQ